MEDRFSHLAEVKTMHTVGAQMPRVMRGETNLLEHLIENSLLDEYYSTAVGMSQVSDWIGEVVGQISLRYPQMKILEIGQFLFSPESSIYPGLYVFFILTMHSNLFRCWNGWCY